MDALLPPAVADPTLERDAHLFYDALSDLIRFYQFRDRDRICCHDISVSQCYALEALVRRDPLTLNDLAAFLYLDKSTASRVVDSLERKGYVARAPHPEDGRSVLLSSTARGRELYARIERDIVAEERGLLADFDPETRSAIIRLFGRIVRTASARMDTAGASCCRTAEP